MRLGCGIAGQKALEVRGAQHQQLTIAQRHNIRGARQAAQQRHFAEEVAASEADWLVRKNDLDSPG